MFSIEVNETEKTFTFESAKCDTIEPQQDESPLKKDNNITDHQEQDQQETVILVAEKQEDEVLNESFEITYSDTQATQVVEERPVETKSEPLPESSIQASANLVEQEVTTLNQNENLEQETPVVVADHVKEESLLVQEPVLTDLAQGKLIKKYFNNTLNYLKLFEKKAKTELVQTKVDEVTKKLTYFNSRRKKELIISFRI